MVDARIFQRKYSYQNTWVLWNQSGSSKMMMVMNKIFAVQLCFFETIVNFVKCLSNYIIYPIVYKIEVLCSKQNQIVLQEKIKKEISIKRDTESSSMEENDSIETDEEGWIVETVSDKTETEDESMQLEEFDLIQLYEEDSGEESSLAQRETEDESEEEIELSRENLTQIDQEEFLQIVYGLIRAEDSDLIQSCEEDSGEETSLSERDLEDDQSIQSEAEESESSEESFSEISQVDIEGLDEILSTKKRIITFLKEWGGAGLMTAYARSATLWLDQQFFEQQQVTNIEGLNVKGKILSFVKPLFILQSKQISNQYGCALIKQHSLRILCKGSSAFLLPRAFEIDNISNILIYLSLVKLTYSQLDQMRSIAKSYISGEISMRERIQQMRHRLTLLLHGIEVV